MKPWAGYTRVSRVGDRDGRLISPELQAGRIADFARSRGLAVELLAPELDQSGGRVDRPVLREAIRGVEEGRYAGLIVAQLDRLSRMELVDALRTIHEIEAAGGQVIAVAENVDPATPEGRMARNMFLSLADMQLGRYRAQFATAKRRAIEHGIWPTGTAPTGYTVTHRKHGGDGHLRVNPERALVVRRAFELRAVGAPWSAVARHLGMAQTSARKVIANRVYLGELRLRISDEQLVKRGAHEPLVTRAVWEAAQLSHPRPARNSHDHVSLLSGLVRCAGCQRLMQADRETRGEREWWYYRCTYRVLSGGLRCPEPAIIAQGLIHDYVERAGLAHLEGLAFLGSDQTAAMASTERALEAAEAELAAFQEVERVSALGAEHFASGMRTRVEAVDAARRRLAEARLARRALPEAGELLELWPQLEVGERRHVLRGALSNVWVKKGRGIDGRVRLIAAGFASKVPPSGAGPAPIDWPDHDLPGEIRPPCPQDVEQRTLRATAQ